MKVAILCGGLGTRLREETEFRPKPMVNIGSRPILWHIMKYFSCFGLHEFVLALGYKSEVIRNYFCHYEIMNNDVTVELGKPNNLFIHHTPAEENWKITLVDTGEKTLKGGRLKKLKKYIPSDTFILTYGDGIANVDITALLNFHKAHGRIGTVTGVNPAARFGELGIDGSRVIEFREKSQKGDNFINGGFFVFNQAIFDYLTTDDSCDLEVGSLEKLANDSELMVFRHPGFWACMDTLRDMEYLNRLWDDGGADWKIW